MLEDMVSAYSHSLCGIGNEININYFFFNLEN